MINPGELRVMNWVHSITHKEDYQINLIDLYQSYTKIDPIPLTEEWLIKFGFNCHWDDDYENHIFSLIRDGLHNDFIIDPSWISQTECDKFVVVHCDFQLDIEIKYVHQLQNLFFALTGEELELKEATK